MMRWIDFRSDTVTQPTPAMRDAMAHAEVGDNVFNDDPTVKKLERLAAEKLGKEAALFVSSGTQGNAVALLANTRRGDAVIMSRICHIADHEAGSYAMLAGISPCFIPEEDGVLPAEQVAFHIQDGRDYMAAPTGLICLENGMSNGKVAPIENMQAVYSVAKERGIPVHLDGARLFHAAASLQTDVAALTANCDTVMCCLSKGLCAPVGSVIAGSQDFIQRAWKWRKILGGGTRQAGILAAAGMIALDQMTARTQEDNELARYLAEQLTALPGVHLTVSDVMINMVFFSVTWPHAVVAALPERLLAEGIKILPAYPTADGKTVFRFVTHHDITRADIDKLVCLLKK